jgi:hypothetical protein
MTHGTKPFEVMEGGLDPIHTIHSGSMLCKPMIFLQSARAQSSGDRYSYIIQVGVWIISFTDNRRENSCMEWNKKCTEN